MSAPEMSEDDTPVPGEKVVEGIDQIVDALANHKSTKKGRRNVIGGLVSLVLVNGFHCGSSIKSNSEMDERLSRVEGKLDAVIAMHATAQKEKDGAQQLVKEAGQRLAQMRRGQLPTVPAPQDEMKADTTPARPVLATGNAH